MRRAVAHKAWSSKSRRSDAGAWSVLGYLGVVALIAVSQAAAAGPKVSQIRVAEQGETEAVVVIEADSAPTFQVFGEGLAFTVELPGADLSAARLAAPKSGRLVEKTQVDKAARRVRFSFYGVVDYDARMNGRRLVVTFTHLGDRATLERLAGLRAEVERLRSPGSRAAPPPSTTSAKAELARIEAEVKRLADRKAAVEAEIQQEAKRRAAARAAAEKELARSRAQQKEIEANLQKDEERRREVARRIEKLEAKHKRARGEIAALEQEQRRLSEANQKLERERQSALSQQAALEKKRAALQAELAAEARKIKIKETLAQLEGELAARRNEVDDLAKRKAEQERAVAELDRKNRALTVEVEQLARTSTGLKKRAEQDRAEAAAATREVSEAKASASRARGEAQAAIAERDKLRGEVRTLAARHKDLRSQVETLTRQQGDAAAAVAALQREERQAKSRLAALRTELGQLDQRVKLARAEAARPASNRGPAKPAAAPVTRPTNRVTVAPAARPTRTVTANRSIDLKRGPTNVYERTNGFFEDDEIGRGALSRITVQARGDKSSRVGIRVDGGAQYNVRREDGEVILTLFDTRAANLDVRRIVDARHLGTTVLRVLPSVEEGGRSRVELTIELRDPGDEVRLGHDDAMLWLLVGA